MLETLALADDALSLAIVAGVAIVAIVGGISASVLNTRSRERSRREIAAYIAEGSMTAEQGEKLMRAKPDGDE